MGGLRAGEPDHKLTALRRLLPAHWFDLLEAEAAQMLGWDRRTANNYLRELQHQSGRTEKAAWGRPTSKSAD